MFFLYGHPFSFNKHSNEKLRIGDIINVVYRNHPNDIVMSFDQFVSDTRVARISIALTEFYRRAG